RCPCGRFAPYAQWQARFSNHQLRTDIRGCPQCRRSSVLQRQDFRSLDPGAVSIRLWNPHTIKVKYNSITDRLVYRHILPRVDADAIRRGDNDFLEDTPWEFVEAALQRKPLKIATDRIFHLRDIPLAGVDSRGMGVPRGMANFRQAFLSQIMQRLNMVLGMEYSTPFRSITPEPMSVGMDRFADLFTSISSGTCH
ncbi:MAG TPA: hypothetical protein VHI52_19030, partial [Verrucomicrobiae bacterium]|nr:hypothetical protein [Verrucomicrobiae bacterium]